MQHQLTFDLPVRAALGREDFFVSPSNEHAVALLDAPELWPNARMLLCGPKGSGKSHLAAVFAASRAAEIISATALQAPKGADRVLVVEDIDQITTRAQEEALFHRINEYQSARQSLLLTGRGAVEGWNLRVNDLVSRLQGTALAQLAPPDDRLLSAICLKMFTDRQISVKPELISYLIKRIDRSFFALNQVIETLDEVSLRLKRPITRQLASEVLKTL